MPPESPEEIGIEPSTPDDGGAATATQAPPKKKPSNLKPRQLPPYKVLLHNDDVNTVEYVVRSIHRLTPLSLEDAIDKTIEAHEGRVALLLVTHKERAELYQEQFVSLSMTVTIEADSA